MAFLLIHLLTYTLFIFTYSFNVHSQYENLIYKIETPSFTLKERFIKSLKQILQHELSEKVWIGYEVQGNGYHNIIFKNKINSYCIPKLEEILDSMEVQAISSHKNHAHIEKVTIAPLDKYCGIEQKVKLPTKDSTYDNKSIDYAILMSFSFESGRPVPCQIIMIPKTQSFDLNGHFLFWLGKSTSQQSVNLLIDLYDHYQYLKIQREILAILNTHQPSSKVLQLYTKIIFTHSDESLKESCLYSLGTYPSEINEQILCKYIAKCKTAHLKKQALIALSQSKSDKALYVLDLIAQKDKNMVIRKEALFSLGQLEHDRSLDSIMEIIISTHDREIAEFGVFVLSQISNRKALSCLVQLYKNHPIVAVRKKAYNWLQRIKENHTLLYKLEEIDNSD